MTRFLFYSFIFRVLSFSWMVSLRCVPRPRKSRQESAPASTPRLPRTRTTERTIVSAPTALYLIRLTSQTPALGLVSCDGQERERETLLCSTQEPPGLFHCLLPPPDGERTLINIHSLSVSPQLLISTRL